MSKFIRPLRCKLTDAEIRERAIKLCERLDSIKQLMNEAKDAAKSYKDRIGGEESAAALLESEIVDGTELRDVQCIEVPFDKGNVMVTVRTDTYAEVSRRPMRDSDRQGELLAEPDPDKSEIDRLCNLLDLSELLGELKRPVTVQAIATLTDEQLTQGKEWAVACKIAESLKNELPAEPVWLPEIINASVDTILSERELQMRVNTIRDLLEKQQIEVTEDQVRAWTKDEQDQVLKWTDSLGGELDLPRPEFLPKPAKKKETKDDAKDNAQVTPALASESAGQGAKPDPDFGLDGQSDGIGEIKMEGSEIIVTPQPSAAQGIEIDQLIDQITRCGVDVRLEVVETWDQVQRGMAKEWALKALAAINEGATREAAPPFFFQ